MSPGGSNTTSDAPCIPGAEIQKPKADPAYPPEFEALDAAFSRALKVADVDAKLALKLAAITGHMNIVAALVVEKALCDVAEREGVE